jgi:hypothetical protein
VLAWTMFISFGLAAKGFGNGDTFKLQETSRVKPVRQQRDFDGGKELGEEACEQQCEDG